MQEATDAAHISRVKDMGLCFVVLITNEELRITD
jgi:hypothetical protein